MDSNFAFTTLNISDKFNSMLGFKIGSIYNKNLAIRNITLMRNIGKYKMYNIPMFPEIGTVYNVYERELNRPVVHYEEGGLLEWNNGIFAAGTDPTLFIDNSALYSKEDSEGVKKEWYSTNSGSVGISGGSALLKRVKDNFDKSLLKNQYLPEEYNIDNYVNGNTTHRDYTQRYKVVNSIDVATNESVDNLDASKPYRTSYNTYLMYNELSESESEEPSVVDVYGKNVKPLESFDVENVDENGFETLRDTSNREPFDSLLHKTNELFKTRKIESIIGRYYTDGEGPKYSRGRNLRKENGKYGNSFESPYCRV